MIIWVGVEEEEEEQLEDGAGIIKCITTRDRHQESEKNNHLVVLMYVFYAANE